MAGLIRRPTEKTTPVRASARRPLLTGFVAGSVVAGVVVAIVFAARDPSGGEEAAGAGPGDRAGRGEEADHAGAAADGASSLAAAKALAEIVGLRLRVGERVLACREAIEGGDFEDARANLDALTAMLETGAPGCSPLTALRRSRSAVEALHRAMKEDDAGALRAAADAVRRAMRYGADARDELAAVLARGAALETRADRIAPPLDAMRAALADRDREGFAAAAEAYFRAVPVPMGRALAPEALRSVLEHRRIRIREAAGREGAGLRALRVELDDRTPAVHATTELPARLTAIGRRICELHDVVATARREIDAYNVVARAGWTLDIEEKVQGQRRALARLREHVAGAAPAGGEGAVIPSTVEGWLELAATLDAAARTLLHDPQAAAARTGEVAAVLHEVGEACDAVEARLPRLGDWLRLFRALRIAKPFNQASRARSLEAIVATYDRQREALERLSRALGFRLDDSVEPVDRAITYYAWNRAFEIPSDAATWDRIRANLRNKARRVHPELRRWKDVLRALPHVRDLEAAVDRALRLRLDRGGRREAAAHLRELWRGPRPEAKTAPPPRAASFFERLQGIRNATEGLWRALERSDMARAAEALAQVDAHLDALVRESGGPGALPPETDRALASQRTLEGQIRARTQLAEVLITARALVASVDPAPLPEALLGIEAVLESIEGVETKSDGDLYELERTVREELSTLSSGAPGSADALRAAVRTWPVPDVYALRAAALNLVHGCRDFDEQIIASAPTIPELVRQRDAALQRGDYARAYCCSAVVANTRERDGDPFTEDIYFCVHALIHVLDDDMLFPYALASRYRSLFPDDPFVEKALLEVEAGLAARRASEASSR